MLTRPRQAPLALLACLLLACTQSGAPSAPTGSGSAQGRSATESGRTQKITAAVRAELPTLSKTLNTIIPGATALDRLVSAGLTAVDDKGILHPQLAENIPTVENGL